MTINEEEVSSKQTMKEEDPEQRPGYPGVGDEEEEGERRRKEG